MNNRYKQIARFFKDGSELLQAGQANQALVCFQSAQGIDPVNPALCLYAGVALHDLKRYEEAVSSYRQAIQFNPDLGEAHNNMGNALLALGRFSDAVNSFTKAAELLHESPVPLAARATALQALGKVAEAEADCRHALVLDPTFPAAHWNLSLNMLLQGRYEEGWQEYEWRWKKPDFTSPLRHSDVPLWDGSPLNGRTILLHAEQGFGDAIQFVRYAPLVASYGGNVVLECHPQLVSIFRGLNGVTSVVAFGEELPAFDCQAPFLTLPRIFGTTLKNIPECPNLSAPTERLVKWRQLAPNGSILKVGIVWAGSSIHHNDSFRSLPLTFFTLFAKLSETSFFSLQMGDAKNQLELSPLSKHVIDLTDHIHDFADTAALIEQLDIVISIDTAVAHLAGTLGKPVWLLLPFAPDWRWLLDRCDSPWYPAMTIFRQKYPGDWNDVIIRTQAALNTVSFNKKSFGSASKD